MRKYVVAAIVCLGLLAVSAMGQTGEVYSLNVVGFQKINASSQGLTMVSTPFDRGVDNTLDDVIGDQLSGAKAQSQADQVIIWTSSNQSYSTYWLHNSGAWYTAGGAPELATNSSIETTMGFWMRNRLGSNQIVVMSGDVVDDDVVTNKLLPGLSMVSYPFSTEININDSGLTNGKGAKAQSQADQVIAWDADLQAYATFWLHNSGVWYTSGGSPEVATNVIVGAGKGFWYRNRDSVDFDWVEPRPYTL